MKNLILVSDVSQLAAACMHYDRLYSSGKQPLLIMDDVPGLDIYDGRHLSKHIGQYQEIFKIKFSDVKQKAYDLFYTLEKAEVCPALNLGKLASYKGVSLWNLSAHRFFAELIPILYYLRITDAILDYERPQDVYLFDNSRIWEKAIFSLCAKKNINCFLQPLKGRGCLKTFRVFFSAVIGFLKRIKRFLISFDLFILNRKKSRRLQKGVKVLFFAPTERFFFSMLPLILKYSEDERLVINDYLSGCKKRLEAYKITYLDSYGLNFYSIFRRKSRNLSRKIHLEIKRNTFLEKFFHEDLCLAALAGNVLRKIIFEEFPERIMEVDATQKAILSFRPKVVIVGGASFKTTLIAKSLSVPVVAIQSIHPIDFIFFGPVLADALTVDGKYWQEYLCARNVQPSKIEVTGSLKLDFLRNEKPFTLKLDNSKKVIIFATNYSSLAMGSIRSQNIRRVKQVCSAVKNIIEAHLIIKLHPFDRDFKIYYDIARDAGLLDFSILKDIEITRLIEHCDLLITHISAASYEAVLMGKNVILLCNSSDYQDEDAWDFKRYGAVMFVDNPLELEDSIRKALFDGKTQSLLKKNREEYILEHVYSCDGNASGRTKRVIDSICAEELCYTGK